ncbi:MAG: hypothetical protein AB9869_23870 [Verrucomicrobiia bacterium]
MMRVAELKGEKTVRALMKRLLAESSESPPPADTDLEAALLRLNPQLGRIRELEKGTAILLPDEFGLAPDRSFAPSGAVEDELLRGTEGAVAELRALMKERVTSGIEGMDRVQSWLKSPAAKEFLRQSPALEEFFAKVVSAGKTLPKEQMTALGVEDKALDRVLSELTSFRKQGRNS